MNIVHEQVFAKSWPVAGTGGNRRHAHQCSEYQPVLSYPELHTKRGVASFGEINILFKVSSF